MFSRSLSDLVGDELFLAGECVSAGLYREIESGREIQLDDAEALPASLDGRVATYACVRHTWGQHLRQSDRENASADTRTSTAPVKASPLESGQKIRVVLADGHAFWRGRVRRMLRNSAFVIVREAIADKEVLEVTHEALPDLLLLDRNAAWEGIIQVLTREHPRIAVVLAASNSNLPDAARALLNGAAGYLVKNIRRDALLFALQAATSGSRIITLNS